MLGVYSYLRYKLPKISKNLKFIKFMTTLGCEVIWSTAHILLSFTNVAISGAFTAQSERLTSLIDPNTFAQIIDKIKK